MTKSQATQFVRDNDDDSDLSEEELSEAFAAIFERQPDDDDIEQGLWSHLCAAV